MEKKSNERMLSVRKLLKKKKPRFLRQDAHKKKRLGKKWRRPKGIHNKVRLNIRGYRRTISVGFKSPRSVRGLDNSGLEIYRVDNIKMLENVDPIKQGIIIARTVGKKKKIDIARKAVSLKIEVLNIKDVNLYIKEFDDMVKKKKEEKDKAKKEKEKKEEKKKEKAKEKEIKEKKKEKEKKEEKTIEEIADEAKELEKKEKDKILTQKNSKG